MVPSAINLRRALTYCVVGLSHGPFLFSRWPIIRHKDARRPLHWFSLFSRKRRRRRDKCFRFWNGGRHMKRWEVLRTGMPFIPPHTTMLSSSNGNRTTDPSPWSSTLRMWAHGEIHVYYFALIRFWFWSELCRFELDCPPMGEITLKSYAHNMLDRVPRFPSFSQTIS